MAFNGDCPLAATYFPRCAPANASSAQAFKRKNPPDARRYGGMARTILFRDHFLRFVPFPDIRRVVGGASAQFAVWRPLFEAAPFLPGCRGDARDAHKIIRKKIFAPGGRGIVNFIRPVHVVLLSHFTALRAASRHWEWDRLDDGHEFRYCLFSYSSRPAWARGLKLLQRLPGQAPGKLGRRQAAATAQVVHLTIPRR